MPNCPICKASRWKDPKKTKGKKVANKVVRYFPLTPRLQRDVQHKNNIQVDDLACYWTSKENIKMNHPWMFPFERYMKKLKNYVRNKAKPEGSIAEGYVAEEALTFCSRYLKDDVETRFNRLGRNDDGLPEEEPDKFEVFRSVCKPTGRMKETRLTTDVMQAVVWFVLNNSPEVDADILAYRDILPSDLLDTARGLNVDEQFITRYLSIKLLKSTEVGRPTSFNDDYAKVKGYNADFINNEDDVVAHVLDDDDVVVSDDDEVNPSTNVEEVLSSDDSDDDN
ncbi:hypothetical protein Tco_0009833 [Tanacetum coccineum]